MNAPGHVALTLPVVWAGTAWLLRHALPPVSPALVALGLPAELVPPPERAAGVAALGAVLAAVGSVLPDVDYPGHGVRGPRGQGARGRPALAAATPLTWPLAVVLYRAWGHRGPTHAPVWPLLGLLLAGAFVLAGVTRGDGRTLALCLVVGFLALGALAHILEDALTPMGCPLLWPRLPPEPRRGAAESAPDLPRLWAATAPLAGTPGARYLEARRGIPLAVAEAAGVRYARDWYGAPAVVFPCHDRAGALVAANGRYLAPRPGAPKTRTCGDLRLGAFATAGAWAADPLVLVEGPVDALALAACGLPAVALVEARPPAWLTERTFGRRVVVALDADATGDARGDELVGRLVDLGADASRWRPPATRGAKDFGDLAAPERGGLAALRPVVGAFVRGLGLSPGPAPGPAPAGPGGVPHGTPVAVVPEGVHEAEGEPLPEVCALGGCGAPVDLFGPDGTPACERHARVLGCLDMP